MDIVSIRLEGCTVLYILVTIILFPELGREKTYFNKWSLSEWVNGLYQLHISTEIGNSLTAAYI